MKQCSLAHRYQRVRYPKDEGYVFLPPPPKKKTVLYQNIRRTAQKTVTLRRHSCFTRKINNTNLSDFTQAGNDSTHGHLHTRTYTHVTGSPVEIQTQNTSERDRPQYDRPPPHRTSVIAQQYSSTTFLSPRFRFRNEKFGTRFEHVIA